MSNKTTWAVLSDGRYIRILFNKEEGAGFEALRLEDLQAYSDLCYRLVNGKELNPTGVSVPVEERDEIQWQADFLSGQFDEGQFNQLILAAPQVELERLRSALTENLAKLVTGELAKDLLAESNDALQKHLGNLLN